VAALLVAGCGGSSDDTSGASTSSGGGGGGDAKATLNLVAYSTPEVVYDEIIPDFQKTTEGKGVQFQSSYGASGDQSRAVEAGQKADVVSFSTEPDMTRLVDAGLVAPDWNAGPNKGLVTTSVVAFVVRPGNPKNIHSWADLLKPGVEVLTPNPFTSGAAKWNLMAAYGANGGKSGDKQAGLDYLTELVKDHVKVQDKSGREALQTFVGGQGDVLLSTSTRRPPPRRRARTSTTCCPTTRCASTSTSPRRRARPRSRRRSWTTSSPSPRRSTSPTGATAPSTRRS
jgi:sulfate transport system substrate-binding protein